MRAAGAVRRADAEGDMRMAKGQAKAKVEEVQGVLLSEKFVYDPEFDSHRNLLNSAHASTNGDGGSIEQLSETIGLFAAIYVEDRTRESIRTKKAFDRIHPQVCPFSGMKPEAVAAVIGEGAQEGESFGKIEQSRAFYRVVKVLTPWKWPIAVACFSQVTPAILDRIIKLFT